MPIYGFHCLCGAELDQYFKMDDNKQVQCACGRQMVRDYSFNVKADIEPYKDNTLGYVKSRRHKDQLMKDKGVRIVDKSEYPKHVQEGMNRDLDQYKHRKRKGENIKFYA